MPSAKEILRGVPTVRAKLSMGGVLYPSFNYGYFYSIQFTRPLKSVYNRRKAQWVLTLRHV